MLCARQLEYKIPRVMQLSTDHDNATLMQHVLFNDTRPAAPVRVITSIHVVVYYEYGTP